MKTFAFSFAKIPYWLRVIDQPGTIISREVFDAGNPADRIGGILVRAPNCRIVDCEIRNVSGIGIAAAPGATGLSIDGNLVENTGMQGINFHDRTADYSGGECKRNTLRNNGLDAITVGGIGKIAVRDNDITACAYAGIYALTGSRNLQIERNVIHECFGGIDVSWTIAGGQRAGTDLTGGIVIARNRVMRCGSGIGTGSNGTLIIGNIVTDSGAANDPLWRASTPTGIGILDACDCIVTDNIAGNTTDASQPEAWTQEAGFVLKRIFTAPLRNQITGNNFSRNKLYPVTGFYAGHYAPAILQGNVTSPNQV